MKNNNKIHLFSSKATLSVLLFSLSLQCLAQSAKYVVLISIDGLRPEFYLKDGWNTPNLHELKNNGVHAKAVISVYPSLTYPAHTTMVTGALPARHGIYSNTIFDPGVSPSRWYWDAKLIRTETLWDAIHKAGLTSAAISWPVSSGAPINYNIPEIWSLDKTVDKVSPIREATTPEGYFEEIENNATGKLTDNDVDNAFLTMDENIGRMASYTIRKYKPNLIAVHFVCVDHFQHTEGTDGQMVKKAIASVDREIQKIVEALTVAGIMDSTAIIITGDHGFSNIHSSIAPNIWLASNGLIKKEKGKTTWKAYFHTSGPFAFLHLKYKGDEATVCHVKQVLNDLPKSIKKTFRIVSRDELDKLGADPEAAFALEPVPGYTFNTDTEGPELKKVTGGAHGYLPSFRQMQTGFIGYGTAFKRGTTIPIMGLENIAPIISQLLHLNFNAKDGTMPSSIFTDY